MYYMYYMYICIYIYICNIYNIYNILFTLYHIYISYIYISYIYNIYNIIYIYNIYNVIVWANMSYLYSPILRTRPQSTHGQVSRDGGSGSKKFCNGPHPWACYKVGPKVTSKYSKRPPSLNQTFPVVYTKFPLEKFFSSYKVGNFPSSLVNRVIRIL